VTADPEVMGVAGLLPQRGRGVIEAFLAVSAVHIAADGVGADLVSDLTKPLLVPLLLVWVLVATDRRPPRWLAIGLGFAFLGDVLLQLPGTLWFLAGMGAFLVMQVCYLVGFAALGSYARLRAQPLVVLGWVLLWVALNLVVGPQLGELRWPILVYSVALTAMAAAAVATGDRRIGVGGVLFLISDLLIGLRAAGLEVPASGVLVMSTYLAAQYLIATGWVDRAGASVQRRTSAVQAR
jgi:uncharacterized membrane protein YhhN